MSLFHDSKPCLHVFLVISIYVASTVLFSLVNAVPYFILQVATEKYIELAKKHGLSPVQLALGFVRDRPFMTSTIIGSTNMDQLKEDIDAFSTAPRPLPPEVVDEIERIFKIYKDPAIV